MIRIPTISERRAQAVAAEQRAIEQETYRRWIVSEVEHLMRARANPGSISFLFEWPEEPPPRLPGPHDQARYGIRNDPPSAFLLNRAGDVKDWTNDISIECDHDGSNCRVVIRPNLMAAPMPTPATV